MTLIFFIYGLAFFSMGMAVLFESGRSPILVERRVLIPLAIFGFVHGFHEWMEMFLVQSDWLVIERPQFWGWSRVMILTVSFSALLVFGLELLHPRRSLDPREKKIWRIGLATYLVAIIAIFLSLFLQQRGSFENVDAVARYLLAVPGAAIAGFALFREARRLSSNGSPALGRVLFVAAVGFWIYACTQLIVSPAEIFPANLINTVAFRMVTGIPVQIIRALMAILITWGLLRAIQENENIRQREYAELQQARLEALNQLEIQINERQKMRKDLLWHVVQAQEEERTRIARELHDETSQTLAAFTLHLATLRGILSENAKALDQLDLLRSLSRRMASGIYHLVRDLRPLLLDDLGLVAAIEYLADSAEKQMGLEVKVDIHGERYRLASTIETSLYRIAQEALTNTARHAGVNGAQIEMSFEPNCVTLTLSDQGIGFSLENIRQGGWGLAGMRERAELIGADLTIQSDPGHGTRIVISVAVDDNSLISTAHEERNIINGKNPDNAGR